MNGGRSQESTLRQQIASCLFFFFFDHVYDSIVDPCVVCRGRTRHHARRTECVTEEGPSALQCAEWLDEPPEVLDDSLGGGEGRGGGSSVT